jgi:predicted enzyme related to lactoylglutathione lyase
MVHPLNSFCFAELLTPDPDAAARFYGDLLGWSVRDAGSGYSMFHLDDRDVRSVRLQPDQHVVGMRQWKGDEAHWASYVKVESVDETVARALVLGATVLAPASDTPGIARTALIGDPEGAVFGLWEPHGVDGTAVETGPGSLWWIELASGDKEKAAAFYTSLFPWTVVDTTTYENGRHGYTLFKLGDRSTSGAFQFEPEWGVMPAWQPYFEVTNFDATAARACELGGEQGWWRDAPHAGRIGIIIDPHGGLFEIAQPLAVTLPSSGA